MSRNRFSHLSRRYTWSVTEGRILLKQWFFRHHPVFTMHVIRKRTIRAPTMALTGVCQYLPLIKQGEGPPVHTAWLAILPGSGRKQLLHVMIIACANYQDQFIDLCCGMYILHTTLHHLILCTSSLNLNVGCPKRPLQTPAHYPIHAPKGALCSQVSISIVHTRHAWYSVSGMAPKNNWNRRIWRADRCSGRYQSLHGGTASLPTDASVLKWYKTLWRSEGLLGQTMHTQAHFSFFERNFFNCLPAPGSICSNNAHKASSPAGNFKLICLSATQIW